MLTSLPSARWACPVSRDLVRGEAGGLLQAPLCSGWPPLNTLGWSPATCRWDGFFHGWTPSKIATVQAPAPSGGCATCVRIPANLRSESNHLLLVRMGIMPKMGPWRRICLVMKHQESAFVGLLDFPCFAMKAIVWCSVIHTHPLHVEHGYTFTLFAWFAT